MCALCRSFNTEFSDKSITVLEKKYILKVKKKTLSYAKFCIDIQNLILKIYNCCYGCESWRRKSQFCRQVSRCIVDGVRSELPYVSGANSRNTHAAMAIRTNTRCRVSRPENLLLKTASSQIIKYHLNSLEQDSNLM